MSTQRTLLFSILIGIALGAECREGPNLNVTVDGPPFTFSGSITAETLSCSSLCGDFGPSFPTNYYTINFPVDAFVYITSCNPLTDFSSFMELNNGDYQCDEISTACPGGTTYGVIQFLIPAQKDLLLAVSAYNYYEIGNYTISVQASTNMVCVPIVVPYSNHTTIYYGTNYYLAPNSIDSCGLSVGERVIWYQISTNPGDIVKLSTCSSKTNFNAMISVFSGNCSSLQCEDITMTPCGNFMGNQVSFIASYSTYLIAIYSGVHDRGGVDYELNIYNQPGSTSSVTPTPVPSPFRSGPHNSNK